MIKMAPVWKLTGFLLAGEFSSRSGFFLLSRSTVSDAFPSVPRFFLFTRFFFFSQANQVFSASRGTLKLSTSSWHGSKPSHGRISRPSKRVRRFPLSPFDLFARLETDGPLSLASSPSKLEVTERYRTPSITSRLFTGMVEITDLINHYGHRGNRGEMGEMRKWIEERGVGVDVLGKVLNLGPSA